MVRELPHDQRASWSESLHMIREPPHDQRASWSESLHICILILMSAMHAFHSTYEYESTSSPNHCVTQCIPLKLQFIIALSICLLIFLILFEFLLPHTMLRILRVNYMVVSYSNCHMPPCLSMQFDTQMHACDTVTVRAVCSGMMTSTGAGLIEFREFLIDIIDDDMIIIDDN